MHSEFPAVYTDQHGTIHTVITNDSKMLSIQLDSVVFSGATFISFEPASKVSIPERFTLDQWGQLTDYKLSCRIPLSTWKDGLPIPGILSLEVDYKKPESIPCDSPDLHFSFEVEGSVIDIGVLQQFEGVFEILQQRLPDNITVRTCYTCQYADYSVYGSDIFGTLLCFRSIKDRYVKVKDKSGFMDLMEHFDEHVQETHVCDEFVPRIKGTGYRG